MADKTYDGDIANDVAKYGTYAALGGGLASAGGLVGVMAAKDYMSPASKVERQKAAHEAAKLGQRTAKAKTLSEAIKKTGKSGIVRSGGKEYHYNKEGVLTHAEQANGKKVYTKAGAEAERRAALERINARNTQTRTTAKEKIPLTRKPKPSQTAKAATNVAENVAESAGKQSAIEAGAKNEIIPYVAKKSIGQNVKDLMKAGAAKTVLGNAGRIGAGVAVGAGYNYLTDGGSFAGKAGNAEGINRIVASQGRGNQDDMNSRRQEAGEAMAEYSRNLGSNYITGTLGLAGEIASGGSTLGVFEAGLSELAGAASNARVSLTGEKQNYQDEIAKNMALRGNYQRQQYMRDEKEFGGDAANYIHGDLSDSSLRAQQNGAVHGAFKPEPGENWLAGMKREEAFGATRRKMDELAAIDDPAQRQAWFDKNKDFLTSADLRGVPVRQRFNFAREAMGGDSARAIHYLNTTGEDRMLGVAAAANPIAPQAPMSPMAQAPTAPMAQATRSPQYSNPGLFGLNSQSAMGGTSQNSMSYPMGQGTMNNQNSMFSVNGMPAADWASNMSKQIQNTRIGTKSAMQQGFNNGAWQDSRPINQRGMGGNAIGQGQTDYMNARGMPSAAQWSAFTNDRQARVKNPELYNQPEEPSIAESIRGGGMPKQNTNDSFSNYTPAQLNSASRTGKPLSSNPIYDTPEGMFNGGPGQISASNMPNPNKGKPIYQSVNNSPYYADKGMQGLVDDSGARNAHNKKYGIVEDLPNPTHY